MLFLATVVRKFNTQTVVSKLNILSLTANRFNSTTGYSEKNLEKFSKVFRTVPSYQETVAAGDYTAYLKAIGFIKHQEAYDKYIEFINKILGGRIELGQVLKYLRTQHDLSQLMQEYAMTLDKDNDGYITKAEFDYGLETLKAHDPNLKEITFKKFLAEADINKDGKISVDEFKDWLNKKFRFN